MEVTEKNGVEIIEHDKFLTIIKTYRDEKTKLDFHYIWLRHHCPCCIHPKTKERIVCPASLSEDIKPIKITTTHTSIAITWENDGHVSIYDLSWLEQHAYRKNQVHIGPESRNLSEITLDSKYFENSQVLISQALAVLGESGFVVIKNYGLDTEKFITQMQAQNLLITPTHFGRYEDLKTNNTTNKNTDQLGYTNSAVNLHTDQPFIEHPPRYQALHCIQKAEKGGENIIADGVQLAQYLRENNKLAFDMLVQNPISFDRKQEQFKSRTQYPIITIKDDTIIQIRHSYFTMAPFNYSFDLMMAWYKAYKAYSNLMNNPRNHNRFLLNSGDILLYDNYRMLHARTEFSGERWLRGVYFS